MSDDSICKIVTIIIYFILILMIPLFLDYLFELTIRKKRRQKIKNLAQIKSQETGKPLIVFNDKNNGVVFTNENWNKGEDFTGDIVQLINEMADNSCVIIVSETLEYIDDTLLIDTINTIKYVSGNDIYAINIEKNSPRIFWDYKIKNIMDESFYLPGDDITWKKPNNLQIKIQNFYSIIFKVLPYKFFAYNPIEK